MATAPVPLPTFASVFLPTTATEFGFFPAPAYVAPTAPSPFSGGYYPSPFPFFPPPPPLPTNPDPPPASVYTAASGLSPNWPIWPPPPPALSPTSPSAATPSSVIPPAPIRERPQPQPAFHTSASKLQPGPIASAATTPSLFGITSTVTAAPGSTSAAAAIPSLEQIQCRKEADIAHRLPREVLQIQRRLEHQQNSIDNLQGTMTSLSEMVAQIAVTVKAKPAGSEKPDMAARTTTAPTPSVGLAPPSGSATIAASAPLMFCAAASSSASSPSDASTAAYVAPQEFDEMPTPRSRYDYCSGHPNQIQSSCVSNLSEQNLEMPQSYGFDNLKHGSVFLADSSKHSFYALPEDYPLERATRDPAFDVYDDETDDPSPEFVDMFTSSPNQLTISFHKAPENASSEQVKGFNKAPETEHASACLNITSDMQNFTLELQQQEYEKTCNCSVLKASDSLVTRSTQLGIQHSRRQLRLQWNPGVHAIPGSTTNRDIVGFLHTSILPRSGISILTDLLLVSNCCVPQQCYFRVPTRLLNHGIQFLWDPGASTPLYYSKAKPPGGLNYVAFGFPKAPNLCNQVCHHVQQLRDPCWNVLVPREGREEWDPGDHGIQFEWDPGILSLMDTMLSTTVVPHQPHSRQTPCTLVILDQPVDMKHFLFQLMLQYSWWCHILHVFPKVQYCHLPIFWHCPYSDRTQQLVCHTSMFSSTEAIHFASSMSTARIVSMRLVLSSDEMAQEGRDMALVDCSAIRECYLVYALLPPTQITPSESSNVAVDELTSPCVVFRLQQSTKWTSTSPNGIASSEYGQTMYYLSEQWEFLHQQGVKKYCNEKNLLSSQNYLQICEMDIIFITFLPP